jgi:hypothetical protein
MHEWKCCIFSLIAYTLVGGFHQELTAAQKKKLKKKAKEKEKKKGGGAEGEEGEEGAEVKKDKKPAKPQSAAVRRLQEELERKRIAEEQRIREEEERIRQVRMGIVASLYWLHVGLNIFFC